MMEKGYTRKQVRLLCEWYLRVRKILITPQVSGIIRAMSTVMDVAAQPTEGRHIALQRPGHEELATSFGGSMAYFIDRRLNGKNKSMVNRQRFLRRYKSQIKQSIAEAINKRSVTDVDSGESVSIPTDDINEPMFHQGRGGTRHRVHPGNDHFVQNDRVERPPGRIRRWRRPGQRQSGR